MIFYLAPCVHKCKFSHCCSHTCYVMLQSSKTCIFLLVDDMLQITPEGKSPIVLGLILEEIASFNPLTQKVFRQCFQSLGHSILLQMCITRQLWRCESPVLMATIQQMVDSSLELAVLKAVRCVLCTFWLVHGASASSYYSIRKYFPRKTGNWKCHKFQNAWTSNGIH